MPRRNKENGLAVPKQINKKEWHCITCGRDFVESSFYLSYSIMTRGNNNRMPVCKKCIEDLFNILVDKYDNCKLAQYRICQMLDIFFDANMYDSAEKQAQDTNSNICKIYMQKINSLPQFRNKVFADSQKWDGDASFEITYNILETFSEDDKRNREDVLDLLGYDPFATENEEDKRFLYNTLNGYLDEETLQDGFKTSAIIEIVKSFNQLEVINRSIAQITANKDITSISHSQLKSLIDSKGNLSRQINTFAKENGISTTHAQNKSKGANTLSGILRELRDKNIRESDVNLFNIRTCESFKQIQDISNKSIMAQLQLDENDYAEMLNEQRRIMLKLQEDVDKLKEENRKLKIELKDEDSMYTVAEDDEEDVVAS